MLRGNQFVRKISSFYSHKALQYILWDVRNSYRLYETAPRRQHLEKRSSKRMLFSHFYCRRKKKGDSSKTSLENRHSMAIRPLTSHNRHTPTIFVWKEQKCLFEKEFFFVWGHLLWLHSFFKKQKSIFLGKKGSILPRSSFFLFYLWPFFSLYKKRNDQRDLYRIPT